MERITKTDEMYFKHETVRELKETIKEIEMTLDEDGELTSRFIDGQELLYRLKCASALLEGYYNHEKSLLELILF